MTHNLYKVSLKLIIYITVLVVIVGGEKKAILYGPVLLVGARLRRVVCAQQAKEPWHGYCLPMEKALNKAKAIQITAEAFPI